MSSFDFNLNNNQNHNNAFKGRNDGIKFFMPDFMAEKKPSFIGLVKSSYTKKHKMENYTRKEYQNRQNSVISGYFVKEKSYKEIIISRINTALCGVLGCLVFVCLLSYYFVIVNEIELRKLSKETIALNYDNADMQNKLDNLQSFSNVDMEVSKSNTLTRAKQVIELSAANIPNVDYGKTSSDEFVNRYLGY